MIPCDVMLHDD